MYETHVTLNGNLTMEPRLNQTRAGVPVASLRMATNSRYFDRVSGTWKDGNSVFLSVTCWRGLAANVSASLHKGDRVLVVGRLRQREYETDDHQQRTVLEIEADTVAADLARASARLTRNARSESGERDEVSDADELGATQGEAAQFDEGGQPEVETAGPWAAGQGDEVDRFAAPVA